jgi:hypothetical protein
LLNSIKKAVSNPHFWLLFFVLQFPSIQPFFFYLGNMLWLMPVYFLGIFIVYAVALDPDRNSLSNFLNKQTIYILLVLILLIVNFVVYPIADNLRFQNVGSDQDDALILAGQRLIKGMSPYAASTYLNNPISTGPGLVILGIPFASKTLYFLFTPVFMALVGILLFLRFKSWAAPNLFLMLMMSTPVFWNRMVTGSDFLAIGSLFIICNLLLFYSWKNAWAKAFIIIFTVLSTSSRLVFLYLILVFGIFLWRRNKSDAIMFTILSWAGTGCLNLAFYLRDPNNFTPVHIIGKGIQILRGSGLIVWTIVACFIGAVVIFSLARNSLERWMLLLFVSVFVPLCLLSLGSLTSFKIGYWQGAQYFGIFMPIYVFYMITSRTFYAKLAYHLESKSDLPPINVTPLK